MDLDKAIEHFNFRMDMSACVTKGDREFNQGVRDLLVELRDKQAVEVLSAKKYLSNLPWKQMEHVESENVEEKDAFINWMNEKGTRIDLGMELIDGQYTRQTMLEILFSKKDIKLLHGLVRKKNSDRFYHIAE